MTPLKDDLAALRLEREPESRSSGRWVKLLILVAVLAAAGWGIWYYTTLERPVQVEVATVTERAAGQQAEVLSASGYVTARRRATVSSKITGKVVEVNVDEGMAVKEGQILARLDDSQARAALALAESQVAAARGQLRESEVRLAEARLSLGRLKELLKAGIVGQADVDTAQAQVDSFQARIESLKEQVSVSQRQLDFEQTNLDNTIIRAPFSGVAISKDAQPGEMVSPVSAGGGFTRTGICTIVDMRSLEVEVDVNENYINRVKNGQEVVATLNAYPDWQIPAVVITTVPAADRQKATVLVRIGFKALDPRILPDMGVKVGFLREAETRPSGPKGALADAGAAPARPIALVPKAAVIKDGAQSYVFVVTQDTVERRAITTGAADGDRLEVAAGLNARERVVINPPATLAAGKKVIAK